jgi:hypothetical protein
MALVMATGRSMARDCLLSSLDSTTRQVRLVLDAQQAMLVLFSEQEAFSIAQTFVERQSGKHDDSKRPQLKAGLEAARKRKASIGWQSAIGCLVIWLTSQG